MLTQSFGHTGTGMRGRVSSAAREAVPCAPQTDRQTDVIQNKYKNKYNSAARLRVRQISAREALLF